MLKLKVTREQVELDYHKQFYNWLDLIKNGLGKEIKEEKIELFYSFGYFLPKVEDKEKLFQENFSKSVDMSFEERLEWELSKVRIFLTVKIGNFSMTDRMPKKYIPSPIFDLIKELTNVKIKIEKGIMNLDPDKILDMNFDEFDIMKFLEQAEENELDVDTILDKISANGIESLTEEELKFLKETK